MRVLIVEDDRELAQSLKVALEESGLSIYFSATVMIWLSVY